MRKSTLTALVSVPLAAAAVTIGALAVPGAAQDPGGRTITLIQGEFGPQRFVDARPLSPTRDQESPRFRTSAGDRLYLDAPLQRVQGGPKAGRIDLELTALRGQGDANVALIRGVIHLSDGEMTLAGRYPSDDGIAITGGTGAYLGASGAVTQDDRGVDTITLR
jgi:hypothetical protein